MSKKRVVEEQQRGGPLLAVQVNELNGVDPDVHAIGLAADVVVVVFPLLGAGASALAVDQLHDVDQLLAEAGRSAVVHA